MTGIYNEDGLVQSPDYAEVMNGTVLPWLEQRQNIHTIQGTDHCPLYCVSYDAEQAIGTVLIVHGFTENALKYAELIRSLLQCRFSVIAYDQRGHGRSWRADGIPHPSVTHVDRFSDYVTDLELVVQSFREIMPEPFLVFAHSMGGAVTSLFMERYPACFSAAVLSAPMIAPNIGSVPPAFALALGSLGIALGKEKKQPFFMKTYSGPESFESSCATDPARFAWYDSIKYGNTAFQNSVPSYRWSVESIHVTKAILAPGAPEKIASPVLLYTAENDFSVLPEPQKALIERVPHGEHRFVHGARHEIYRSVNDVLFPWWHEVITYFTERSALREKGENR